MKHRNLIVLVSILTTLFLSVGIAHAKKIKAIQISEDEYRLEINVDVPPEFLFPYLSEEDKTVKWNKDDGIEVTFPKGEEPRVGKQIRVMVKIPGKPWFVMEIVEFKPPSLLRTKMIDGFFAGEFAYKLIPTESGTLLAQEISVEPRNKIAKSIWNMVGRKIYHKKMGGFLKEIKRVVEREYRQAHKKKARPE